MALPVSGTVVAALVVGSAVGAAGTLWVKASAPPAESQRLAEVAEGGAARSAADAWEWGDDAERRVQQRSTAQPWFDAGERAERGVDPDSAAALGDESGAVGPLDAPSPDGGIQRRVERSGGETLITLDNSDQREGDAGESASAAIERLELAYQEQLRAERERSLALQESELQARRTAQAAQERATQLADLHQRELALARARGEADEARRSAARAAEGSVVVQQTTAVVTPPPVYYFPSYASAPSAPSRVAPPARSALPSGSPLLPHRAAHDPFGRTDYDEHYVAPTGASGFGRWRR